MMPSKFTLHAIAALCLAGVGSTAIAAEVPAVFDARSCKAEYPKAALMNEEQGVVSMMFLVSAEGRVLESKLDKTSGFKSLDKAALKAVAECKFKPGMKDGKPDSTWTKVDYNWTLG
ncbi:energy transducer TonB [Massilia sp. PAMC28688]|uniref:energy transducer TonB n=1 Tax=Massilia sp. PAMC28688 TaxID=2861283 RepID=UPI001C62B144|nr:energy transducer TonB [Massilia sp. PAMC28688]QYF94080.1 energy transducer TonB [Massilia sp. PAMC28688]